MADEKKTEQTLDEAVIGMTKEDAVAKIKAANHKARVVAVDGEDFMRTMDFWPDRLNLEIVDGKVVKVSRG